MGGALLAGVASLAMFASVAPAIAQPNIVVVMTDDQREVDIPLMQEVQERIADRGITYQNAYASYPLCCPSRATFFTGQYAHNHGVRHNGAPLGGDEAFTNPETTLAPTLDAAGYRTGFVGRYLNGHRVTDPVPPGWDYWRGYIGGGAYDYDLQLTSGSTTHFGTTPEDYRTSVYADKAVEFVHDAHARKVPFFLKVATNAVHAEGGAHPTPGPFYQGRYNDEPLPEPPSFLEADVADKPEFIRDSVTWSAAKIARTTAYHRARLASAIPVDKLVRDVIVALQQDNEWADTYFFFTSDNGYLLGEHRAQAKYLLYEESASIPLIAKGPEFPGGRTRARLVGNIDLAPTFYDIANAEPQRTVDGASLLEPPIPGRNLLLENFGESDLGYPGGSKGVQDGEFVYIEHANGEKELYDLNTDPFQLQSLHDDPTYDAVETGLEARLRTLEDCTGSSCL